MSNKKKRYYGQQMYQKAQGQEQQKTQTLIGRKLRTSSGFEYTLKAQNLQDMRFLDTLVAMEDESLTEAERVTNMVRFLRLALGETQKDAFYAHIVRIYGWASPAAVGKELRDILNNFDQGKKK